MSDNRQRKPPFLILTLLVFTIVLTIAIAPLESAIELPKALKPFAFQLVLILAIILCLIAVWQYFLQRKLEEQTSSPMSSQNRKNLITKVNKKTWIKVMLDKSLYTKAPLSLRLQVQPGVSDNPWQRALQQADPPQIMPEGTGIVQVYDQAKGELLILGEPSAGKTTLLLELARELLRRAESDERLPIPLVFSLSSWAAKRQPLADWLVEEMNIKYQISRKLAHAWVDTDQVLPLLDGFDETAEAFQTECAEAISTFQQAHDDLALVICSQSAQSLPLKQQVEFSLIVEVQPLTAEQIDRYLVSVGEQAEAVRLALSTEPELRELVTTPFTLSVLILAYNSRPDQVRFTEGSLEDRRRLLFGAYVEAMLQRRIPKTRYSIQQTLFWLRCLAQQLVQHDQTEFYLERLQADWLPDTRLRLAYRVVLCLVFGLLNGLVIGLLVGLASKKVLAGLYLGLSFGLLFGLVGLQKTIKPAEVITWSWQNVRKQLDKVLSVGLSGVLGGVLVIGLLNGMLFGGLVIGLALGLFFVLFTGLILGLSPEMLDTRKRETPNRGIWRSARYGLFGALGGVLSLVLLSSVFSGGQDFGLGYVLLLGLFFGMIMGQILGGFAFMQHFILRCFLWKTGLMPWNYVLFLDDAAERTFLRKVGGGYIFIHRLLLEYFATLDTASTPSAGAKHMQIAPPTP